MTIAGNFITDLQAEQRIGNVSSETEQHLKHEFRKLGRDASGPTLAATVEAEKSTVSKDGQRMLVEAGHRLTWAGHLYVYTVN
jgi:hypothetical protein